MPLPTGELTLQEQALSGQAMVAEPAQVPLQPPPPQQQPTNMDGSPNVLYQAPAPMAPPPQEDPLVAQYQQQLAQAQQQAQPAGFGEKLARGLLALPGIRQTVGRVAEPFLPDREGAAKQAIDLGEKLTARQQQLGTQAGEFQGPLDFLKQFSPSIYQRALALPPVQQAAFVKSAVDSITLGANIGDRREQFAWNKDQAKKDEQFRWAKLQQDLLEGGIKRQEKLSEKDEKQYLKDENEVRGTQQRAIGAMRTSPFVTRLMTAKIGADDVHALLMSSTQGGEGKIVLNAPSVGEVMASLQRTLSMGGQSSVEMLKEITPQSLHRDVQKMREFVTGNPQEVLTEAQFKNLLRVSERQQQFLGDKLRIFYGGVKKSLVPVFKRDAERSPDGKSYLEQVFDAGLNSAALEVIGGGTTTLDTIAARIQELEAKAKEK